MTPWLDDGDVRLYHGSALTVLAKLPAESVQTVVTSPPYWGLRDYGTGAWDGGDLDCDHLRPAAHGYDPFATSTLGPKRDGVSATNSAHSDDVKRQQYAGVCGRCGARRIDSQLGLEPTPTAYVESMVAAFREVWRVLRADGTLWLNLGDSYASSSTYNTTNSLHTEHGWKQDSERRPNVGAVDGLKPKDLVGIPWRVAFALQADGWYLRSDIIWAKPNPMPESVTDRPTKSHEYLFLLSKSARYYYDADSIREPADPGSVAREGRARLTPYAAPGQSPNRRHGSDGEWQTAGRNARSVWEIATQPTPEAHFATYPEELVRRCILAGTSEFGECVDCGKPWVRQVERRDLSDRERVRNVGGRRDGLTRGAGPGDGFYSEVETTGWTPSCHCVCAPARPQTVLDPFVGSGTTALVARRHGRRAIGVDLNADYLAIAARRTAQLSLLADGPAA